MPWSDISAMGYKKRFIDDLLDRRHSFADVCALHGVSRKTGYKWLNRFKELGQEGLAERSHAVHVVHNKTPVEIEQALVALRCRHPSWGARKLAHVLTLEQPQLLLPHEATICEILSRNGLVMSRPRRRPIGHPGRPNLQIAQPNDCWSADFKGQFKTGNGRYCHPLTVTDNHSRFLLECKALAGTLLQPTQRCFTRLFKEFGLPARIRTDNGVPFAASSLGRLSRLSVWWLKLGVMPELIEPGKPQQNGRHERMHRTLKAETAQPPAYSSQAQQRRFAAFMHEFNHLRPHEALDMRTPAQLYRASPRQMPDKLLEPEYPDRFELRLVSGNGGIRWHKHWVNVSSVLTGETIGLEEVGDGEWDVYFGPKKLGRLLERHMRIEDHMGQLRRM